MQLPPPALPPRWLGAAGAKRRAVAAAVALPSRLLNLLATLEQCAKFQAIWRDFIFRPLLPPPPPSPPKRRRAGERILRNAFPVPFFCCTRPGAVPGPLPSTRFCPRPPAARPAPPRPHACPACSASSSTLPRPAGLSLCSYCVGAALPQRTHAFTCRYVNGQLKLEPECEELGMWSMRQAFWGSRHCITAGCQEARARGLRVGARGRGPFLAPPPSQHGGP